MYAYLFNIPYDKRALEYLSAVLGLGLITICGLALAANSHWYF